MDLGGKVIEKIVSEPELGCLNPCFGGFGWESVSFRNNKLENWYVLILVLVDLGGKVNLFRH